MIVDEYQDCDLTQHAIIDALANLVPTSVLGDPMQAIFDFAGAVVDWNAHVLERFRIRLPGSAGGEHLGDVRRRLLSARGKPPARASLSVSCSGFNN